MTDAIELCPPVEDDLPMLEKLTWDRDSTGEFGFFGWFDQRYWRRQWAENGLIGPEGGALIVVGGQERVGFVNWRRRNSTPADHFWEIGIALLPGARGHGYGVRAQRMLAEYLFAHTTAHRVEALTEVANTAEQRALEKAGFTREGVIRGVGWRDGRHRDGVLYSLLRTDLPG